MRPLSVFRSISCHAIGEAAVVGRVGVFRKVYWWSCPSTSLLLGEALDVDEHVP
jgi:hypothetical protein